MKMEWGYDMKAKMISVYDPSEDDCTIVTDTLEELVGRSGVKAIIKSFTDREAFTYDFRDNHYDVAFVGINTFMDFEAARSVRKLDEKCSLFLVSRTDEYALEGIRMRVMDYIIKPMTAARLRESLSRINLPLPPNVDSG